MAVLLLALFSPLMLLIAVLVKLTSEGPALYRQERVGLGGRVFWLYKFRTMRNNAEAETGPVWAVRNDPRQTALGNLLRRLSLDELPQLLNVVRGEMSLVGPRPERPYFVRQFAETLPDYTRRHEVRPGLTGWAQVHGYRGNTSLARRLEYDLDYLARRSLGLDLWILLRTPCEVLFAQDAG